MNVLKLLIPATLFGLGVFIFSSGWQQYLSVEKNWAGQECQFYADCTHPEWFGLGAMLILFSLAIVIQTLRSKSKTMSHTATASHNKVVWLGQWISRLSNAHKALIGGVVLAITSLVGVQYGVKIRVSNEYPRCAMQAPADIILTNNTPFPQIPSQFHVKILSQSDETVEISVVRPTKELAPFTSSVFCIESSYYNTFMGIESQVEVGDEEGRFSAFDALRESDRRNLFRGEHKFRVEFF